MNEIEFHKYVYDLFIICCLFLICSQNSKFLGLWLRVVSVAVSVPVSNSQFPSFQPEFSSIYRFFTTCPMAGGEMAQTGVSPRHPSDECQALSGISKLAAHSVKLRAPDTRYQIRYYVYNSNSAQFEP